MTIEERAAAEYRTILKARYAESAYLIELRNTLRAEFPDKPWSWKVARLVDSALYASGVIDGQIGKFDPEYATRARDRTAGEWAAIHREAIEQYKLGELVPELGESEGDDK